LIFVGLIVAQVIQRFVQVCLLFHWLRLSQHCFCSGCFAAQRVTKRQRSLIRGSVYVVGW
jgi:hypothetical protein